MSLLRCEQAKVHALPDRPSLVRRKLCGGEAAGVVAASAGCWHLQSWQVWQELTGP